MNERGYDTAQICTAGHVITAMLVTKPELSQKFCNKCGAPTIINCQNCSAVIRGCYLTPNISGFLPYTVPRFCHECGKPYPWTEAKLEAAKELSDELENLSPDERDLLKKSLDDVVRDTPRTTVAVNRFKKLVAKAGRPAADAFRDILVDIVSEAVKKLIWP